MVTSTYQPAPRAADLFHNSVRNPVPKNRLAEQPKDTLTQVLSFLESSEQRDLMTVTSRKSDGRARLITKMEIAVSLKTQMKNNKRATWKELQRYRELKGVDFSSGGILELDLADSHVNEDQLRNLLERFPNVQSISFARCRNLRLKTLNEFLQKRRKESLEHLIHLCHGLEDEKFRMAAALAEQKKHSEKVLMDLCSKNLALKELAEKQNIPLLIEKALQSPNDVIKRAAERAQTTLEAVNALVYLCATSKDSEMKVLARNSYGLERLDFTSTNISDIDVLSLLPYCSNLLHLDLSGGHHLTDLTLRGVAKNCRALQVLILYECRNVSDAGLKAVAQKCLALQTLNITSCRRITDTGLEVVTLWCRNLHTLDLSWCSRITERGFQSVAQNCWKLQTFTLMGCRRITDDNIQELARKCPALVSFNLIGCRQITDAGIQAIAHNCRSLQTLKLIGCNQITDMSIRSLARGCPRLQVVNFTNCSELTDRGLMDLAENCPQIHTLYLLGCNRLTYAIIETFFSRCPNLQEILSPKGHTIRRLDHENLANAKRPQSNHLLYTLIHVLSTCMLGWIASYTISWQAASSLSLLYLGHKYYYVNPRSRPPPNPLDQSF